MSDVRLTATNPADSSVVPVACNDKGELLVDFNGNVSGDLTVSGSGTFGGAIQSGDSNGRGRMLVDSVGTDAQRGRIILETNPATFGSAECFQIYQGATETCVIKADGRATFADDVVIGSRGSKWKIVESGGIAHLVQEVFVMADSPLEDSAVEDSATVYPDLRNLPRELDLVEQALTEVMQKLHMTPPSGFPVWDGSDEIS